MSAGISFCLMVCFLVCSSGAQTISAELGQEVILPCKVPNIIVIRAVEWSRPDLEPEYVFLYRHGRLDPENQHPSYENRVYLQDKDMKDGDFYLVLKDVTREDTGTYECRVFEKGKNELISNITLEVVERGARSAGDKERISGGHPGVLGAKPLVAVLASVSFLI